MRAITLTQGQVAMVDDADDGYMWQRTRKRGEK